MPWNATPGLALSNRALRVRTHPAWGGRLTSLLQRETMREWLWSNPTLTPSPPSYGASYVETADTGGFDECFPSIAAGPYPIAPWQGLAIPDHGELWGLPWDVEPGENRLRMGVDGRQFPYRFERTLELVDDDAVLNLAYRVTNRSPARFPFLWCAHPLLAIEPGMRLLIPEDTEVRVWGANGLEAGERGTRWRWPHVAGRDLATVPAPSAAFSIKLFTAMPLRGWVGLHDPRTATTLRFEADPAEVTHLGLWLNYGGWSPQGEPYYNLAIEPGLGAGDDLSVAWNDLRDASVLEGHAQRTWHLKLVWHREDLA